MKKILFAVAVTIIPAMAAINGAYAQVSNNITSVELLKNTLKMDATITAGNDYTVDMNAISNKAVKDLKKSYKELKGSYFAARDFKKLHKNASDAKWYKTSDGLMADFNSDGIDNKIFYTIGGRWMASLKGYNQDKLAPGINNIVNDNYAGYKINYVQEIETSETHGTPTYIIHIQNGNQFKLVRVSGDETDVYQEFTKQ